jgi:hemerythrin-like domain-containing protein
MKAMLDSLPAAGRGNRPALKEFVTHARSYIRLLREHIWKEDNRLFPMADHVLGEEDQQKLANAFERAELVEMGLGTHEKYLDLANELAERFDVPHESLEPMTPGCVHCCHSAAK